MCVCVCVCVLAKKREWVFVLESKSEKKPLRLLDVFQTKNGIRGTQTTNRRKEGRKKDRK